MATTNWKFAGTIVGEKITVDDLNKMKTADDIFAVCSTVYNVKSTDYHILYFTNFGFSSADIPVGATILGIEVEVKRYTGTSGVTNRYYIMPMEGTYYKDGGSWPVSAGVQNMGGGSDLWERSWTRDNILSSDFGVRLTIATLTDSTFYIDYVKIRVTYSGGETVPEYSVTYDGNESTGGSVPTDENTYEEDEEVTVLGNTGNLVKTGYVFVSWNTAADGSGTDYAPAATFSITSNTTLYAQWAESGDKIQLKNISLIKPALEKISLTTPCLIKSK